MASFSRHLFATGCINGSSTMKLAKNKVQQIELCNLPCWRGYCFEFEDIGLAINSGKLLFYF